MSGAERGTLIALLTKYRDAANGIDDALAAVEAMAAAFVETGPNAAAKMGGVQGIIALAEMTAIEPMLRLTVDEGPRWRRSSPQSRPLPSLHDRWPGNVSLGQFRRH